MLRSVIGLCSVLAFTVPAFAAAGFDAPLKTETLPTGAKSALHCLTYPNFLLRWEDEGSGTTPLILVTTGKGPWTCTVDIKGQKHFGRWEVVRVKGRYVILSQRPNATYGLAFAVFDTERWRYVATSTVVGDFSAIRLDGAALVLQYRSQAHMECSLYYGAATGCWGEVKARSGLTDDLMPDCRTVYEKQKKELDVADITDYAATVTFNVEARIADGKVIYTSRPGAITCTL